MKRLAFLHNLIQYFFFFSLLPHSSPFSPCHHPWQMMLFALQLLLQAKSNQWAAGPAFHFEKCQVRACLNPHIICVTVGGLSLRLTFLQWLQQDFGAWTKIWGGSEKHLRAVGKTCSWLARTIVPSSPSMWHLPGCLCGEEGPSTTVCSRWISPCCHTLKPHVRSPCWTLP